MKNRELQAEIPENKVEGNREKEEEFLGQKDRILRIPKYSYENIG